MRFYHAPVHSIYCAYQRYSLFLRLKRLRTVHSDSPLRPRIYSSPQDLPFAVTVNNKVEDVNALLLKAVVIVQKVIGWRCWLNAYGLKAWNAPHAVLCDNVHNSVPIFVLIRRIFQGRKPVRIHHNAT